MDSCTVMRSNRNRCQQCRFKKCMSVGMSRDGKAPPPPPPFEAISLLHTSSVKEALVDIM